MRSIHLVACATALVLIAGAIAAGCISSDGAAPDGNGTDGGGFDAFVANDGGSIPVADSGGVTSPDAAATGTLWTTTVDFGLVSCGTGTGSQTYSFKNTGPVPIDYAATISAGAVFSIDGVTSGTVAPGASGNITIAVGSIPSTSTAGTPITGMLVVSTNIPGLASVQVPLSVTPQGGSLTVSPALAGFGQVQLATDGTPIPLTIGNAGNAPVTITIGTPSVPDGGAPDTEFGIVYPGSPAGVLLAPGGSLADAGATFHPTTAGLKSVTALLQTNDPLCASPATAIAMSGTGTAAQVTVGPDPLQFGTTLCGQTAAALQVTIKNASPAPVPFTDLLKLGAASPFTIDLAAGSIPGGTSANPGKAVITVTPKKISPPASVIAGAFNDTLVVTPTAPGLTPTSIALQQSASGAILAVAMASTAFGTVLNQPKALPFTVTNSGNLDAPLLLTPAGAGYSAAFTGTSTATAGGGTAPGNVTFDPSANGADNGTLTVTTSAALCAATPAPISLTATGAVPVAGFTATPIALASTCGAGAGSPGSLTVSNTGSSPLTITSVTSKSGYFTFTNPGTIPAGGNAAIPLTASAIATGAGPTGGSTLNDTLSFTTNEVGSPTHTVPVTVAVSGANLAFDVGSSLTVSACTPVPYSVLNTGNMPAFVAALGGTYPNDDYFYFNGDAFGASTQINAGASVGDTVGYGSVCGMSQAPCLLEGTQSYSSLGAAGSSSGVCVALPVLNLTYSLTGSCNDCC